MAQKITGDYRQYMDKTYIGEWDLPEKEDLIVEIDHAEINTVENERGKEEKLTLHLVGHKPLILNVTNSEAISEALGSRKVEKWSGQRIALYRESVRAFGKTTLAVRVRPFMPKTEEIICIDCGAVIEPFGKYTAKQMAETSKGKYGRYLCLDCAKKAKDALEKELEEGDVLNESNKN